MKKLNAITDVPGINVGHSSDFKALTGSTVILGEQALIASVERAVTKADGLGVVPAYRDTIALKRKM